MIFDFIEGEILLIDKELGWTSFDVVKSIRGSLKKVLQQKKFKVGHAGTLDPLASGLLLVCTGKLTKTIDSLQAQHKVYTGSITLGATTPSYDRETEVDQHFPTEHITPDLLRQVAKQFEGDIAQTPPVYSAIKIDGKRAYEYARNQEEVSIKSRIIHIESFEITRIEMPEVFFEVKCSKGTYIRSLARDFGIALQSGAHLSSLRRTQIGDYKVADALKMDTLKALIHNEKESPRRPE
jgi:tRNA pseudouridine55 synthase